jgi:3-oxoacyl-[acyl-carrier protein] reductase
LHWLQADRVELAGVVSVRLAKDGFTVVLNYAGNADKAEQVANEVKTTGGQTLIIQADVSHEADVERMFKQSSTRSGLGSSTNRHLPASEF